MPGLDLITAAAWSPLVTVLNAQLPAWSSPAMPAVFASNYGAVARLFARLRVFAAGHAVLAPLQPANTTTTTSSSAVTTTRSTFASITAGSSIVTSSTPATLASSLPTLVSSASRLVASPTSTALRAALAPKLSVYLALRSGEASSRMDAALTGVKAAVADAGMGLPPPPLPAFLPLPPHHGGAASASGGGSGVGGGAPQRLVISDLLAGIPAEYISAAAMAVSAAEGTSIPHPSPSATVTLRLSASIALWTTLTWLWSPAVLLPPLAPALLSLTLAAVGRYGAWATTGAAVGAQRWGGGSGSVGEAVAVALHLQQTAITAGVVPGRAPSPPPSGSPHASAPPLLLPPFPALPPSWKRGLAEALAKASPYSASLVAAAAAATASSSASSSASSAAAGVGGGVAGATVRGGAAAAAAITASYSPLCDAAAWADVPLEAHLALPADVAALTTLITAVLLPRIAAALLLDPSPDSALVAPAHHYASQPQHASSALSAETNTSFAATSASGANGSGGGHNSVLGPLAAAASALATACAPLCALTPYHHGVVRAALSRAVLPGLAGLKAVPATHRMQMMSQQSQSVAGGVGGGGGSAPSGKPSAYTGMVVRPLRSAVAGAVKAGLLLPPGYIGPAPSFSDGSIIDAASISESAPLCGAHTAALALGVAADVGGALDTSLEGILASLAHMEQSLAWLKKPAAAASSASSSVGADVATAGSATATSLAATATQGTATASGASGSGAVTDAHRIGAQLLLDTRTIARELAEEVMGTAAAASAGGAGGTAASTSTSVFSVEAACAWMGVSAAAPHGTAAALGVVVLSGCPAVDGLPGFVAVAGRLAPFASAVATTGGAAGKR